jgi:hypothetical protein
VVHFEAVGAAGLRLEWERDGAPREVIDPGHFSPGKIWEAVTDDRGEFAIPGVPAILDVREFRAECPAPTPASSNNTKCTVVLE